MNRSSTVILLAVAALAAGTARADEKTIRDVLSARVPDAKIVSVQKLRQACLYEVAIRHADGEYAVLYTDESAQVVFVGNVIDTATQRNLTEARLRQLTAIGWSSLPWQSAITMKRGKGRREIAIFSDSNCPYCRKFEADLATLDDLTVHIFPYPVIKPDSVRQAKSAWCSSDRAKAWTELMQKRIEPEAKPDCATPIGELLALGRRLGAVATPTWFLPNGERYSGAMRMSELVPLLDATARTK